MGIAVGQTLFHNTTSLPTVNGGGGGGGQR